MACANISSRSFGTVGKPSGKRLDVAGTGKGNGDMDLGSIISILLNYDRDQGRVKNEFTDTVSVIVTSFGKTTRSIENWLSLIKLPAEVQSALKEGTLPVSQGYLFASNLDNPSLKKIFNDVAEKPVTNDQLKMKFVTAAQAGKANAARSPQPIKNLRAKVKSVRTPALPPRCRTRADDGEKGQDRR